MQFNIIPEPVVSWDAAPNDKVIGKRLIII